MNNDYPYLATWCDSVDEADRLDKEIMRVGWVHWNGVYGYRPPNYIRYQGKTYTWKEFRTEVWRLTSE